MTQTVTLEWYERLVAKMVGSTRRHFSEQKGSKDVNGPPDDNAVENHQHSAAAEAAVAKFTGRYWPATINTYKTLGDVGELEVRSSYNPKAFLTVYPHDNPNRPYVLVTGRMPTFRIHGWIWGWEAQQRPDWLRQRPDWRPRYAVPQSALRDPVFLLPAEIPLPGEAVWPTATASS